METKKVEQSIKEIQVLADQGKLTLESILKIFFLEIRREVSRIPPIFGKN